MNIEDKKELISVFVSAGIAYYLKGDWRAAFKLSKTHKRWASKTNKEFELALDNFFKVY